MFIRHQGLVDVCFLIWAFVGTSVLPLHLFYEKPLISNLLDLLHHVCPLALRQRYAA